MAVSQRAHPVRRRGGVIQESFQDKAFLVVIYIIVTLILIAVVYPILYVVSASFSSAQAVAEGRVYLWPVDVSLEGYALVFEDKEILTGFKNTLFYTGVGTLVNMILTILLAFPLSRKTLPGRNVVTFFIAFTMYFSGGLIPTYLLMDELSLVDTRWAMIFPTAISTFNMIIMRTYFQSSIPDELQESAHLDGCNNWIFLIRIVLPLSAPILAVVALYYGVAHWNAYFNALIYLRSSSLISLQLVLRNILLANQINAGGTDASAFSERAMIGVTIKYAVMVVSSIPMMIIYPFAQRYFIKGVMVGALKG